MRIFARCVAALALLVILCWPATGDAANDPDLDWWTIETEHFHIHYEKGLEPVAIRVARLSEDIHRRLVGPLGYTPSSITHVALTDFTDDANGSATGVPYNAVRLFVTAPGDLTPLADHDDWYLALMTHEYTHILHVDNVSGIPSVVNTVLGKTLVPNQVQPRWFIEGLAVVAESAYTSGGRNRSSLFDMYMRADVLANNIAGLDQMSSSPRRWPQGTVWYLYGSRFMQWLSDIYGQDALRAVAADYGASVVPWGINRAIKRQTGHTYIELYKGFKDHLRRSVNRHMKQVYKRGLREGWRITHHGRSVFYPQFIPEPARTGGRYQLSYYLDDFNKRHGHYRIDLTERGSSEVADPELWARANDAGPAGYAPDGSMLISSVVPFKRIYNRNDLFMLAPKQRATRGIERHRKRLTTGLRAVAPTVSPDGRHVVFTTNKRGTTTLKTATLSPEGKFGRPRTLVRGKRYDQAYTPVFSPDGRTIAYSAWRRGGFRDIRLVSFPDGKVSHITNDRAVDSNPCWSPDGETLYFSSDRTGIFNIYAYSLKDKKLKQVTNVRLGAMMPTVSPDGKKLVYVGYTHKGYDLFAMDLVPARYLEPIIEPYERPRRRAEPPPVKMTKHRYNALTTLRPRNYLVELAPGRFSNNAVTLRASGADIAGLHALNASAIIDPGAPLPEVSLDYSYLRLPFDLNVRINNGVSRRSDFLFNNERQDYIERRYAVSTGISYRHLSEFANQSFALGYTATLIDGRLPIERAQPFDPYASPTVEPFRGFLSLIRLGYGFSNVEGSFDATGNLRGTAFNLSLDYADETTGSSENLYSVSYSAIGYMGMPWPGHHTLAVRSSGGMSKGTYSRRGLFFVGGYNLETAFSPLSLIAGGPLFSGFALRGYPPGAYAGSNFMLQNFEYRIPIADVDRGISTLPIYLKRVSTNLFLDYGGAYNDLDFDAVKWFSQGSLIYSPQLATSTGVELWFDATIGYVVEMQLRLGYAYGYSAAAVDGGQLYFVSSAAF